MRKTSSIFRHLKLDENTPAVEVVDGTSIVPQTIKQHHIAGLIVKTGLAADLPSGATDTKMYYETDTKRLKIWNQPAGVWDMVQFS